jgi:hypothetical protein
MLVLYANPFFLPSKVVFVHQRTACSFLVVLLLGWAKGLQQGSPLCSTAGYWWRRNEYHWQSIRSLAAWLLAISERKNKYLQRSIWELVLLDCWLLVWMKISGNASRQKSAQLLAIDDKEEWKSPTKLPDTHLLDCWLGKVGINIADEASRHSSARLLAIGWGWNENCRQSIQAVLCSIAGYQWWRNEYHQQSIQTLVCSTWASSEGRNEYCQQSIWELVFLTAGYRYEWKSPAKHPDKKLLKSLLAMMETLKIADEASKYLPTQLLAISEGRNKCCQPSIWTLVCSTAGYLVMSKWKSPMKHPGSPLLNCWLLVMEEWK